MPYIDGKRVSLAEWRARNPYKKWPPEPEAPEPEPEVPAAKRTRKNKATAEAAIKAATGRKVNLATEAVSKPPAPAA